MYVYCDKGNWYLYHKQKDKNGKWFIRTIAKFGKTKPDFKIPFIYRGMCDDLISSIKDKSINLILTDPPYSITQNKWDIKPDWKVMAKEYERILKDNGLIVIFGTIPNIIEVYNNFISFFELRFDINWVKGSASAMWVSNYKPLRTHETIFVFSKKDIDLKETTFNLKLIGEKDKPYTMKRKLTSTNQGEWKNTQFETKSDGIRFPTSTIEISGVGSGHKEYVGFPTQKPEKLMEFFIRGLSNVNDIILDPYLGSGTVAKVSMENCRYCIGSEIDPISYPIIKKRLKKAIQQYDVDWKTDDSILQFQLKNMMESMI